MKKILICLAVFTCLMLYGCTPDDVPHTHTFDTNTYAYDNTYHWHPAACEHTSEVSDKVEHTFNEDGSCWYCDYADRTGSLPDIGQTVTAPNGLEMGVGLSEGDGCIVLGIGSCTDADVVIPEACAGRPVTGIADRAFEACATIESVVIPDTVTVIGEGAFGYCENLRAVTLPKDLTEIRPTTFIICGALESIELPGGLKTIGMSAFNGCQSLTEMEVPDNVTEIGDFAFNACSSLATLKLSSTLSSIGEAAFGDCDILDGVILPESLTKLGEHAFSGCDLRAVTIPGSIKDIEAGAFANCRVLETVTIENGVKSIGYGAFQNSGVKTLHIPSSVTSFGENAFYECDTESVYIDDLTAWCRASFANLDAQPMNDLYVSSTLYLDACAVSDLVVPSGITTVRDYAFAGISFNSVTLPDSTKTIGAYAFHGCNMSDISGLTNVESIGKFAFAYSGLESFVVPRATERISEGAFYKCEKLKSVTLHKNLAYIEAHAFWSCTSLVEIHYGGTAEEWKLVRKDYEWDKKAGDYVVSFTTSD